MAYPAPMLPAAPARLSTMAGWPHFLCSWSAMIRAKVSVVAPGAAGTTILIDRKSTRLNSSHSQISYAVFCLKKKIRRGGRNDIPSYHQPATEHLQEPPV